MTSLPPLFVAAALLICALTSLTLWSRRGLWVRGGALALAFAALLVLYVGLLDLLSRPKPVALEWLRTAEAVVLGAVPVEGEAIYLWLALPGEAKPFYYVLPWVRAHAEQLQQAQEDAGKKGQVKTRLLAEPSLDDRERIFYPEPQPALPPKEGA